MRRFLLLSVGVCFIFCGFQIKESPSGKKINSSYGSYLKGLLSDRYGDYQKALEEYLKADKLDEGSLSLKLRVAVQYIKLNEIDKALEILRELKNYRPINLDAYILLLLIYSSRGEEKEANQIYEEMLSGLYKEQPTNLKVAESLAQFKLQKKNYQASLEIYKNILKIKPDYPEAYFWIGYIYEESAQRDKAIKAWKKGLKLQPDHPDMLNSLGYIYAEEGINLDEAESLISKALEARPDSPAYLDSLGWVYFKKKNYLKAKDYIERACQFLNDPVILEHLGDIYYCLGEIEKAKKVWTDALRLQPDKESLKKRLDGEYGPCQDKVSKEEGK